MRAKYCNFVRWNGDEILCVFSIAVLVGENNATNVVELNLLFVWLFEEQKFVCFFFFRLAVVEYVTALWFQDKRNDYKLKAVITNSLKLYHKLSFFFFLFLWNNLFWLFISSVSPWKYSFFMALCFDFISYFFEDSKFFMICSCFFFFSFFLHHFIKINVYYTILTEQRNIILCYLFICTNIKSSRFACNFWIYGLAFGI